MQRGNEAGGGYCVLALYLTIFLFRLIFSFWRCARLRFFFGGGGNWGLVPGRGFGPRIYRRAAASRGVGRIPAADGQRGRGWWRGEGPLQRHLRGRRVGAHDQVGGNCSLFLCIYCRNTRHISGFVTPYFSPICFRKVAHAAAGIHCGGRGARLARPRLCRAGPWRGPGPGRPAAPQRWQQWCSKCHAALERRSTAPRRPVSPPGGRCKRRRRRWHCRHDI